MSTSSEVISDTDLMEGVLTRVANDLTMITDRTVDINVIDTERIRERTQGEDQIHISFKLRFQGANGSGQGCALVPLPDALTLVAYLMMVPDEEVLDRRELTMLDRTTKDAMLEVGNFMAGAMDAVVRNWFPDGCSVRSDGCQGVRAGVRPALEYAEGDELVLTRAQAQVGDFPPFELLVMLPTLETLL